MRKRERNKKTERRVLRQARIEAEQYLQHENNERFERMQQKARKDMSKEHYPQIPADLR